MDDLGACDLRFQALQSWCAPPAEEGAIAELGDSLERQEGGPAGETGLVLLSERGSGSEPGAVDVCVDNDRTAGLDQL